MKVYRPKGDAEPIIVIKGGYQGFKFIDDSVELVPASLLSWEVVNCPLDYEDVTVEFADDVVLPDWSDIEFLEHMYLQDEDDSDEVE